MSKPEGRIGWVSQNDPTNAFICDAPLIAGAEKVHIYHPSQLAELEEWVRGSIIGVAAQFYEERKDRQFDGDEVAYHLRFLLNKDAPGEPTEVEKLVAEAYAKVRREALEEVEPLLPCAFGDGPDNPDRHCVCGNCMAVRRIRALAEKEPK